MASRQDRVNSGRPPLKQRFGKGSMILVGALSLGAILAIFVGVIIVYGGLNAG